MNTNHELRTTNYEIMIGILALQGAFAEHQKILEVLGQRTLLVKKPSQLKVIEGLVFCGGESTTIALLLKKYDFLKPLEDFVKNHPVLATCAGLIVLAKEVKGGKTCLPVLDISVKRNAFGRQYDSFEENLDIVLLGRKSYPATFIRAPWIEKAGSDVDVLARFQKNIVAVKQGNIIGTSFHPELTNDTRFHQYFISLVRMKEKEAKSNKSFNQQPITNNQ